MILCLCELMTSVQKVGISKLCKKLTFKLRYLLFQKFDIQDYMISDGTLLGFLRHGDIIPHDHDFDISVGSFKTFRFLKDKESLLPQDIRGGIKIHAFQM